MLLPLLSDRIATPAGLRAYWKDPILDDIPGQRGGSPSATRVETVTYMIETPGHYVLPGISLSWWNTRSRSIEAATTAPVTFDVAAPARAPANFSQSWFRLSTFWIAGALATFMALIAMPVLWSRKGKSIASSSENQDYRALQRAVRSAPAGQLRSAVRVWLASAPFGHATPGGEIEEALIAIERTAYGSSQGDASRRLDAERRALLKALAVRRSKLRSQKVGKGAGALPALNPF